MKKQKQNFYNFRNRSGQFYARAQVINNQKTARLVMTIFIILAILSTLAN